MNVPFGLRLAVSIVMPLLIVNYGYKKKSLSLSGAFSSLVVGFLLTFSNLCFFSSLLAFFALASCVTKLKADLKRKIEDDFKEGGQRNWIQVICNGGVAAVASVLYLIEVGSGERAVDFAHDFNASVFSMALLGSLACSSGDTWASEIGSVFSNQPRLVTTWRKVPVGTNGGVTLIGTLASVLGGGVVGIAYYATISVIMTYVMNGNFPPQWPIVVTGFLGGFLGSLIDSFIGAQWQYSGYCEVKKKIVHEPSTTSKHICGKAMLSNHGVNLVSSLATAVVMPVIAYALWEYI